jgi:hypothetical protein
LPVLPINKRPERWKEYVGFETYGGIKNKKVTYNVTFAEIKDTFNKSEG